RRAAAHGGGTRRQRRPQRRDPRRAAAGRRRPRARARTLMAAFGETLRELMAELRRQRTRAVLSLLGLAWGAPAGVRLLAFSIGFEALFQERTRGMGDGVAVAWPRRTTKPWRGFAVGRPIRITRDDGLQMAGAVPELAAVSPEFATWERVRAGDRVLRV